MIRETCFFLGGGGGKFWVIVYGFQFKHIQAILQVLNNLLDNPSSFTARSVKRRMLGLFFLV